MICPHCGEPVAWGRRVGSNGPQGLWNCPSCRTLLRINPGSRGVTAGLVIMAVLAPYILSGTLGVGSPWLLSAAALVPLALAGAWFFWGERAEALVPGQGPPLRCWRCGYDLRGLYEGVCPECGAGRFNLVGSQPEAPEAPPPLMPSSFDYPHPDPTGSIVRSKAGRVLLLVSTNPLIACGAESIFHAVLRLHGGAPALDGDAHRGARLLSEREVEALAPDGVLVLSPIPSGSLALEARADAERRLLEPLLRLRMPAASAGRLRVLFEVFDPATLAAEVGDTLDGWSRHRAP